MRIFVIALFLSGALGCSQIENKEPRIQAITAQKAEEWKSANPDKPITLELQNGFRKEAELQVASEIKKDRSEAGEKAAEVAINLATGNYVAGAIGIIGLLGLALGIYGKGKQPKKPEA